MATLKQGARSSLPVALPAAFLDCNTRLRRSTRRSRTDYCQRDNVPEALQRSREYAIRETPLADIAEPGADRRGAAKTGSCAAPDQREAGRGSCAVAD